MSLNQQTIQPGNGSGIQQATFGDPKNIQPGECYNIWVNMESCETTWVSSLKNSHCIPETPSPITPPVIFTETIPVSSPEPPPSGLSVTVVAVLVIIIVLILCLVFIAVYRRIRVCPTPYAGINDSPPDIEEEIPIPTDYRHDEIRKLVFFYCLSRESKKCVQEFEKFLKLACGEDRPIEFIDFVNQDEIDINTGSWITNLVGKIDERGCHLLVIYSSGLVHLFEAENDGMCYPGYMNKEHNGEYVISFFKRIRDDLLTYNSHRGKERVISLGSKYTNAIVVARSLANFSGYKPMLLSDNSGRVSVNMLEMCEFLESLGIAAPKEALKRIDTGPLERAVEEMLSVEKDSKWFRKRYGNPQKRSSEVGVEKRYSSSSDASASDIGPQEQSSSGFGTASYGDQYTDYVTVSQPSHLQGQSHNLLHEHRLNNQCLLSVYPPCEQTDKDNGLLPADSTKPGFPDDWDPVAPRLLDEDSHV
ncbi:uncharacterized protein LOC135470450 isoform X2 [Liolophura sinensis]|uniref:uncharacterized protein LOC135470450 isoform X2 n=1 Tax=Liolophura sinensis TaxID=3198878 RepID=UPI003158957D